MVASPSQPPAPPASDRPQSPTADGPGPVSVSAAHEGATALRNALKLGASLFLTWGVALVVTFKLPNYLGSLSYGHYKVGEQFAMSAAVFLSLGVDTYASREVAVRPKHASDFFLGVLLTRALVLLPLVAYGVFWASDKVEERALAAALFGFAYVFNSLNQTFQQMLQAASKVGGLAVANVVAKILWGGGLFAAVFLKAPFWVLPLPMIASEVMKAGFLFIATRDAVALELRLDVQQTKEVLKISLPFFVANVAVSLGSSIDVVVLGGMLPQSSPEVGWYGAAREVARLSALLSPILSGVLIPMMSRAKARNEEEFFRILRRGIEGVNVVSIPLTLGLALGADLWIHLALRDEFLPAASSLRWLAPTFVLSYGNVLLWLALMILGRSWTITGVSIFGLILLPVFIAVAVPLTQGTGPGGAGMGCAMAMSARELVVILVFLAFLGKRAIDRRVASNTLKSLLVSAIVIGAHVAMTRLGYVRVAVDAALYAVLALGLGILRPRDVIAVLKMIKDRKKPQPVTG